MKKNNSKSGKSTENQESGFDEVANERSDEEIISILKKIGFEYTEADDHILNRKIEHGGSNLSVGEKQLICIAGAIE